MTDNAAAANLHPVIKSRDGIDDALLEVGRRYWRLDGFDNDSGRPRWSETAGKIDCSPWGWGAGRTYIVAAAAVRAVLPDRACPQCGGELALTSRNALEKIALGEQPGICADCDESLQEQAARVLDPKRLRRAHEQHDQYARQQRGQQLRREWNDQRQTVLRDTYEVTWLPHEPIPPAPVRVELITLALLRYAPTPAPLGPVREWVDPLHPDVNEQNHCVAEALRGGLIKIHPASHIDSFVWEPANFDEALAHADEEGQIPVPSLAGSYYTLSATHFTPYGHSLETAATAVRDHLTARLDPTTLTASRQQELLATAVEVLAEETVRYFEYLLDEHNLPAVPDNHRDKLVEAAHTAASVRPLSELYNLAWRSARDAAAAAQRNPQAPRTNMTVHGVNRFESNAQRALDLRVEIKPYGPVSGLELSAMTRTLFLRVLQQDPFSTSVMEIEETLPPPAIGEPEQDLSADSDVESDFGQLACTECGFPVPQQDAWLWVEVREAFTYLEKKARSLEAADLRQAFLEQWPASWKLSHTACGSDIGAVCEIRLPTTYRALVSWTATILQERSKWIHGSDFAALLAEAAQHTGRFRDIARRDK